jgi:signal transduction histidine kinase/ActR/RegA family two-component response regulator
MTREFDYFVSVFELFDLRGQKLEISQWPISRVLQGETLVNVELRARRTDTAQEWFFSISGAPIYDERDELILGVVVTRDITEQRRMQEAREALLKSEQTLREEAEQSNQLKDEFLAVLSHELRTPMHVIVGWSSILANSNLDESTLKQAVEVIERNSRLQMQLIEDLLDVSRIITGKMRIDKQQMHLCDVVSAVVETLRPAAEARHIDVTLSGVKLDVPDNDMIFGDAARLQQVVWNLLSNAIKFSHDGGRVEINLRREPEQIVIQVRDNGQGIAPEFLPHVFDRFRQADSSSTRRSSGLGLGLAIAKHLVELHGGTIEVHSAGLGTGAEFLVRLPAPALQRESNKSPESTSSGNGNAKGRSVKTGPLSGVSVLAVDDDRDALELVALMLRREGAEVLCADSAHAALQEFDVKAPQLLISDIGMPEMDGYGLIEQIRARADGASQVPALALTAYAGAADRQQALLSGFNEHLTKPVASAELLRVVLQLLGRSAEQKP